MIFLWIFIYTIFKTCYQLVMLLINIWGACAVVNQHWTQVKTRRWSGSLLWWKPWQLFPKEKREIVRFWVKVDRIDRKESEILLIFLQNDSREAFHLFYTTFPSTCTTRDPVTTLQQTNSLPGQFLVEFFYPKFSHISRPIWLALYFWLWFSYM